MNSSTSSDGSGAVTVRTWSFDLSQTWTSPELRPPAMKHPVDKWIKRQRVLLPGGIVWDTFSPFIQSLPPLGKLCNFSYLNKRSIYQANVPKKPKSNEDLLNARLGKNLYTKAKKMNNTLGPTYHFQRLLELSNSSKTSSTILTVSEPDRQKGNISLRKDPAATYRSRHLELSKLLLIMY